jgi:hypothetical protein
LCSSLAQEPDATNETEKGGVELLEMASKAQLLSWLPCMKMAWTAQIGIIMLF